MSSEREGRVRQQGQDEGKGTQARNRRLTDGLFDLIRLEMRESVGKKLADVVSQVLGVAVGSRAGGRVEDGRFGGSVDAEVDESLKEHRLGLETWEQGKGKNGGQRELPRRRDTVA